MGSVRLNKIDMSAIPNPPVNSVVVGIDLDGSTKQKDSTGNIIYLSEPLSRSSITLDIVDMTLLANPSVGTMLIAIDLDGTLKTKNSSGTITPIGGGGGGTFASDILVSLSGGKTFGKYVDGETIPSMGLTPEQVLNLVAIEDIAPTYTPATLVLTDSASNQDEVGTVYSDGLTATFTQNDAGALSSIRIQKNGVDMTPNGSSSPFIKADFGSYVLGNITFIAYADYAAGIIKTYSPSGNPDARTPLIRNVNAPQAAEVAFASNTVLLTGTYKIFYGPSSSVPGTSAAVRALPSNRFTDAGNTFILNTGSTEVNYTVAMPATMSLVSVIDLDALNANITANYILSTFNVNDAGGTPVSYKVYTMTNGVAYASNHQHQITVS
jgi:hypothetical protein